MATSLLSRDLFLLEARSAALFFVAVSTLLSYTLCFAIHGNAVITAAAKFHQLARCLPLGWGTRDIDMKEHETLARLSTYHPTYENKPASRHASKVTCCSAYVCLIHHLHCHCWSCTLRVRPSARSFPVNGWTIPLKAEGVVSIAFSMLSLCLIARITIF